MQIPRPVLDGIRAGEVSLAFRRWDRPRARVGARHRTQVGLVAIDAVDEITIGEITDVDAQAAGTSYADLRSYLDGRDGQVYRIRLSYAGPDPREQLREAVDLDADQVERITARLARLDRASRNGPWTAGVLGLIAAHPGRRAPDLAAMCGRATQPFKTDVRKLKELGLTESLEVGYRISPRGHAYLAWRSGS